QVIPVNRGDDAMLYAHELHRGCHALRLVVIHGQRPSGRHRTERTGAGADIAQDHERSRAGAPAFAHVRTISAFTDRMKLVIINKGAYVCVFFASRQFYTEPIWFSF